MPPTLALSIFLVLLLALLYFDPEWESCTALALWVPLIWLFFAGSRLPSQWLGVGNGGGAAQNLEEGNPLDAAIFSLLILVAIGILLLRSFNWRDFFSRNLALMALLSFALISVVWSDFPFVAFKRWFRDLGYYLVILVAVSDPRPLDAVRTVLRRLCYVLIPLSILLDKYFPDLSKQYETWTGVGYFAGATTSKNMLGVLCLISGIFFFWDTVARWPDRKERRTKLIIFVNVIFFAMSVWLLNVSDSATCNVCITIGCLVILAAHTGWNRRHPGFLKVLIPATFFLYLLLAFGFDMNGQMAQQVGRNSTLTDRTAIWATALGMHTNPIIGTGYDSFWLGPRITEFWRRSDTTVIEAHNGYLEAYLNLGLAGDFLLVVFLIASYRTIWKKFKVSNCLASLGLAMWIVTIFYNMTEAAALKGSLTWIVFTMVAVEVSQRAEDRVRSATEVEGAGAPTRFLRPPLEVARQRR